jgi:hypothetical protein
VIHLAGEFSTGAAPGKSASLYRILPALDDLPDDVATLKAMLLAERAQSERLRHLLAQLRRAQFGRKSEKGGVDQLNLGLEDIETAVAAEDANLEKGDANLSQANTQSELPFQSILTALQFADGSRSRRSPASRDRARYIRRHSRRHGRKERS